MRVRLAGVAVLAVLAAGCGGGGGGSSSDAESVVPANALAFATIDTDKSSAQVSSALKILDKFPIEPRAEQQLRASIKDSGVDFNALTSSAGSEVDIAVINVNGQQLPVGLAKPSDENAFVAQLDKTESKHTTMDGWTVFADKQATLDAFKQQSSGSDIGDDATYQAAIKSLPVRCDRALLRLSGRRGRAAQGCGESEPPVNVARPAPICAVVRRSADV